MFLKRRKNNKGTKKINTKLLNKRKIFLMIAILVMITIIISSIFLQKNKTNKILLTPEIVRSKAYEIAKEKDNKVTDIGGKVINSIRFDAYFIKDLDGDGIAESRLRGNCGEIGKSANLYIDLSIENNGSVKNAKITINSKNFTFKTSLLKDEVLANDYISGNTKELVLNEIKDSVQKNIIGTVEAMIDDSDSTSLSKENSIIFSGTYVDKEGTETEFRKEVKFIIDWYGEVDCNIQTNYAPIIVDSVQDLVKEDVITFDFSVNTYESKNALPLKEATISGTIPEFNGFKPSTVVISGTNVTYTYDEATGDFTAKREAILNANGTIKQNAYSYGKDNIRINTFRLKVSYPKEVYEQIKEARTLELEIPLEANNKGYNNPNGEFQNPYLSNTAKEIVNVVFNVGEIKDLYFGLGIGEYQSPYNTQVISKNKPLNLYHNISETEENDTYSVTWGIYTGNQKEIDRIVMQEPQGKEDTFQTTEGNHISMSDYVAYKAIYFSGVQNTLGKDGWIKLYDAETNTLIKEFNSTNWNLYTRSSNAYQYDKKVKHIRIETSSAKKQSSLWFYHIKELEDELITEKFTEEEFSNFRYIETNFYGEAIYGTQKSSGSLIDRALYIEPTSIANISLKDEYGYIINSETKENEIITISTDTTSYNTQKWKNGIFLVQMPSDIILAEINSITVTNKNVKVLAYDLYKESNDYQNNENYYLKILTENENPAGFEIKIDCNLTPDPRMPRKNITFNLYATNEIASQYYYSAEDVYDIDADLNTEEEINYTQTDLAVESGTGLNTTQLVLDYDNFDSITIAPNIAMIDENRKTAKIEISATNNYATGIKDIKIMGVIPFEGNKYIISKTDMGSTYTTHLTEELIEAKTEAIEGKYTIYYSEKENPTQDLEDRNNGWTLKEKIQNIENIKTYLIVFDSEYTIYKGDTIEFTYRINIPEGIKYNQITYAQHGIYYALMAEEGLYYTSAAVGKVGILVAKKYDLEIVKYQTDKQKTLQGVTFTLLEEGEENSSIQTTDANGKLIFRNLFAERYYILKEQKTTEDYEISNEEIKFYTYIKMEEDGTKQIHIVSNKDNVDSTLEKTYQTVRKTSVLEKDKKSKADFKLQLEIENEPKVKLTIKKTDQETKQALKNAKFKLTGEGIEKTLLTDKNGNINVSGLALKKEYTLEEMKVQDYYLPSKPIKFMIENNNGTFEFINYQDNRTTKTKTITLENEIPTINLELQNEKIPSYSLQLTKYAKEEKDKNGQAKTLAGAQYQIWGEGISEKGKIYQTDENGVLTIPNLYEYIEGKDITGEYTLKEVYAPEGYSVNNVEFKFRALRDETGTLKIEIQEGKEIIRTIVEETETKEDLKISEASSKNPIIEMGVEDAPIFRILKYTQDGGAKTPIPGAKFKITDLDGNPMVGTDGKIIEELTTDEKGIITANLPEGYYKAVEVAVGDRYELPEKEEDRTYYFGIGASRPASHDWKNGVLGRGWNYINGVEATNDGGVIAVGSFSKYPTQLVAGATDGIDIDEDDVMDEVSQGNDDGIIIRYDAQGEPIWSKSFGGDDDDVFNKIIQTKDDGYMAVGYVSSKNVTYDGKKIEELSTPDSTILGKKDAVMLKLDKNGNYEWGVRFGGLRDEEIKSVIQTSNENFVVVGNYNSETFHVLEKGSNEVKKELKRYAPPEDITTANKNNAFVACYSTLGSYNWATTMRYEDEYYYINDAVDVKEYSNTLVIAANLLYKYYDHPMAMVYKLKLTDGTKIEEDDYFNFIRFNENTKITSIDIMQDTIIAGINNFNEDNAQIYQILWNSTNPEYNEILCELSGGSIYISSVKATLDSKLILGGWYYDSIRNFYYWDDNHKYVECFPYPDGNESNGFVILLELEKNENQYNWIRSEYVSRLHGEDEYDGANGYVGITSVTQTKSGQVVSGGYFNGTNLNATKYKEDTDWKWKLLEDVKLLDGKGNSEGFVISGNSPGGAAIAEARSLEIENKVKALKITTQVIKNNDQLGGTITGDTGTIGGITYSEDGIRYVETVTYGNNSTKEIVITPDTNYNIESITINGEKKTDYIQNADGTVTIPIFEEVKENIHVAVIFSNTSSNIEINHYLWKGNIENSTEKVAPTETITGKVGDSYVAIPVVEIDYDVINNLDYYKEGNVPEGKNAGDFYIPDNAKGSYEAGKKEVINYYYKEKTYTLTVHHYLEGTNEQVPLKGGNLGQTVEDVVTENLEKGSTYQTEKAGEDQIDYGIYELVQIPENAIGTIERNTEVFYYYKIKTTSFTMTKVAEEDHSKTIKGTQFALYQYIGNNKEEDQKELIDKNEVDLTKWKLIRNQATSSMGNISFEDLPITELYRLVEIKASEGRVIADGQWNIEFVKDKEEENRVTVEEGLYLKITAIGNPPAFAIEEGKLLIPNKELFTFPTSGAIGIKGFYKTGLTIIAIGGILFFLRLRKVAIQKNTSKGKHSKKR